MAGDHGYVEHARPAPSPSSDRRLRVLLAVGVAAALVVTAVVFFRWGTARPPAGSAAPTPSASTEGPRRLSVAQIYQTLLPSVVSIKATAGAPEGGVASGTGLIVNTAGIILTALHVVQSGGSIEVTFADGTRSAASVVAAAPAIDIAALAPESLPVVVVPAVLGGAISVGDEVVAIGNQLGLADSATAGVVSGLGRSIVRPGAADLEGLIQFDAAVNPGSSGGPLVNTRGETVGIVIALANPTNAGTFIGIGFAVPIGAALGAGGGDQLPQR